MGEARLWAKPGILRNPVEKPPQVTSYIAPNETSGAMRFALRLCSAQAYCTLHYALAFAAVFVEFPELRDTLDGFPRWASKHRIVIDAGPGWR